jgi:hypothetical protein
MLEHCIFFCTILLTMCHVTLYEGRYTSNNWHVKSKVDRPYFVKGFKKKGSFTVRRGTQTLQFSPPSMGQPLSSHSNTMTTFVQCYHCQCTNHKVTQCPLLQCSRCSEFGHNTAAHCKKTLTDK